MSAAAKFLLARHSPLYFSIPSFNSLSTLRSGVNQKVVRQAPIVTACNSPADLQMLLEMLELELVLVLHRCAPECGDFHK